MTYTIGKKKELYGITLQSTVEESNPYSGLKNVMDGCILLFSYYLFIKTKLLKTQV